MSGPWYERHTMPGCAVIGPPSSGPVTAGSVQYGLAFLSAAGLHHQGEVAVDTPASPTHVCALWQPFSYMRCRHVLAFPVTTPTAAALFARAADPAMDSPSLGQPFSQRSVENRSPESNKCVLTEVGKSDMAKAEVIAFWVLSALQRAARHSRRRGCGEWAACRTPVNLITPMGPVVMRC